MIRITKFRKGFMTGMNSITGMDETEDNTGIEINILEIEKGWIEPDWESLEKIKAETCIILLKGKGYCKIKGREVMIERSSLLEQSPFCLLVPYGEKYEIIPESHMELARIRVRNSKDFEPRIFTPEKAKVEERGKGLVDNAVFRIVRTVFDYENMPESNLAIGEVVNFPGRWSSYPPHHHVQPEIYFYRFWPKNGYGFCQLEDRILKVKDNDVVKILNGVSHPQVAAPGYAMWYLWMVRHLPDNPYKDVTYDKEHEWTLDPKAKVWRLDKTT